MTGYITTVVWKQRDIHSKHSGYISISYGIIYSSSHPIIKRHYKVACENLASTFCSVSDKAHSLRNF